MTYILTRCKGGEDGKRSFINPPPWMIDKAIDALRPHTDDEDSFIILRNEDKDEAVYGCWYVQTKDISEDPEKVYLVEARFTRYEYFQHCRAFLQDTDEVKKIFRMFLKDIDPDVSGWEVVNDKLAALQSSQPQPDAGMGTVYMPDDD